MEALFLNDWKTCACLNLRGEDEYTLGAILKIPLQQQKLILTYPRQT